MTELWRGRYCYSDDNGNEHTFDTYKSKRSEADVVYTIYLDDEFFATAESRREEWDTIQTHASVMGWKNGKERQYV